MTWVLLAAGLVVLTVGAELLVRGAVRLATSFGVSPLVVGLTVVAFGTSAPEIAASIAAAMAGRGDLALANVVGSNIFNVFGILGIAAAAAPLGVALRLIRIDVPIVLAVSLVVAGMAADGALSRWDGGVLLAVIVGHTVWTVRAARRETVRNIELPQPSGPPGSPTIRAFAMVVCGLAGLVIGARWLVDGATALAAAFGVSERVVGLTVVAAGTSLPELATSVVAGVRGQRDIAVGNVVGSNLFNLTAVLGGSLVLAPSGIAVSAGVMRVDVPMLVLSAVVCLPVFLTGFEVSRREGIALFATFSTYMAWIVLHAGGRQLPLAVTVALLAAGGAALVVTFGSALGQLLRSRRPS